MISKKEILSCDFGCWVSFFSNESTLGTIFACIFRDFVYQIFRDLVKVSKVSIDFAQISADFAWVSQILLRFSPNENFWGALAPPAPSLLHH